MTAPSLQTIQDNVEAVERLLKSLANANRLKVLCLLVVGERSVSELEQQVGLSQSALSQHLTKLRKQGVVSCRKDGTTVYYRVISEPVLQIMTLLHAAYCNRSVH